MSNKLIRESSIDFPGNSTTQKPEKERPSAVVTGKVRRKKKSLTEKFSETFFGDDTTSVMDYLFHDVLVPALKNTISDMVSGGIEMLLFGQKRDKGVRRDSGRSYVSYASYAGAQRETRGRERPSLARTTRANYTFDDIIFGSREEAENVLSVLVDLTIQYDNASVSDFYDLCNIDAEYTDHKYGWTTLRDAVVERAREGFIIRLPVALPLDR